MNTNDEFKKKKKKFTEMTVKLRKYQDEILSFSKYIENIMSSISDILVVTSKDLSIKTINNSVSKLLGYNPKELINKSIFTLFSDKHAPDYKDLKQKFTEGNCKNIETILKAKNGEELIFLCSLSLLKNKFNEVSDYIFIFRDITELKKSEEKQKELESQIQHIQRLDSISILASGIAHDFNNILTAIIANISLLKMNIQKGTSNYEILEDAERAARIAKNLTQQLLSFSKRSVSTKKEIDLTQLIKDTLSFTLRGSEIVYELDIDKDLWIIEGDENQINQVFHNLIINAKQAMEDKGKIIISAKNVSISNSPILPDGKYVKISISDTGPGIKKEISDKIFDPYFTTKETGSGLGLSISYYIIKNHNGHIEVDTKPGTGTTFTIFLPAIEEKNKQYEKNHENISPQKIKGTVLVMDDDEFILKTYNRMLNFLGVNTILCKNGEEAIETYKNLLKENKNVDAFILDLTVPGGMGAKEAINKIKSLNPHAKIILSTGYSMDPITTNYKDYGFYAVITKPFEIKDISRILNKIFNEN